LLGAHKCNSVGNVCHKLSASKDEFGGCQKVRDTHKFLENYPWITKGYETFNTMHNSFVVADCLHYEKCPPRREFTAMEINRIKDSLESYAYD